MSDIRILAIEDEPIHAEALRLAIEELGYLPIEITNDVNDFLRLAKAAVPDVLVIDIDLGAAIDGIGLAERVGSFCSAPIVYVTASRDKETILRARDVGAAGYITKPYEPSSLQAAIEIAVGARMGQAPANKATGAIKNLFVKQDNRLIKINSDDIRFVEVKEKFCSFQLVGGKVEVNMRLKDLVESLPAGQFIQVHRSFVVAIDHIAEITPGTHSMIVEGVEIPVGKNYKEDLLTRLNKVG